VTRNSIRLRLLLAAALMIVIALAASALSIMLIFQRHLEKRVQLELDKNFTQLMANIEEKPNGTLDLIQQLADPRFELPLSGLYWQIDLAGEPVAKSRSLWDQRLVVPTPPKEAEEAHIHELAGPEGQNLYALERVVFLNQGGVERQFVVTVGLERGEISDTVLSMTRDVVPALTVLGLVLLCATWFQVSHGLRPLSQIEKALSGIRAGADSRMGEDVPQEVKPLVGQLNALLAANEVRNRHARQRAADLAHGLRTPLTILGSVSRTVENGGLPAEAEKIRVQTEHMRQQVERELAKALSSAEDSAQWFPVEDMLRRLVNVVAMEGSKNFKWDIDLPRGIEMKITRNDFNEIFGNLLENAQKWGYANARVSSDGLEFAIEDDGPGVSPENMQRLTERGYTTRDSNAPGGLGLSIVQELADKNTIKLGFAPSAMGGLAVRLTCLPGCVRISEGLITAPTLPSATTLAPEI
jgi:signal transduction histidine kinase